MAEIFKRDNYLKQITPHIGKEIIKIVVGHRRVGKSYFLRQVRDYIINLNPKANIIYVDKESFDFVEIVHASDLVKYATEHSSDSHNVLFVDEVQEIREFQKAIRHFFSKGFDIYLSGSNSNMLSGELATLLSGRYIQVKMNPLCFEEFCTFHNRKPDNETLDMYIRFGGMPYLRNVTINDEVVYNYLKNIYQTVLLKDVVARYNVKYVDLLERLVLFLADNTGSIVSAKKITDFLQSQKLKISNSVIINYLNYLNNAFLVAQVKRFDLQGKRFLEIGEKYYFADTGMRNALTGFRPRDINKILENLVYNHLVYLDFSVSVGKWYDLEIDFIAERKNERYYFQVAYLLSDNKVMEREFGNLEKINDNYPKYVISMDDFSFDSQSGIIHLKLIDFLRKTEL